MDKNSNDNHVGSVLREFRIQKSLSQEGLAELAKVHRTYVGGVERGTRNPSFRTLSRIVMALEVSWVEFGDALDKTSSKDKGEDIL